MTEQESQAAPFLKWVGGKRQLLPQLIARVPKFNRYYEPFLGGGALFFAVGRRGRAALLGDTNPRLVRTYQAVRLDPEEVIELLDEYVEHYRRNGADFYYEVRDSDPDKGTNAQVAAWMIFLNKTGFNGLYRVNRAGKFNVPHGKWKSPPRICDAEGIRAASAALSTRAVVNHMDYHETVMMAQRGDFVYFDPPYAPLTPTSNFTSFTSGGFGDDDQRQLRDLALRLKKAGVQVLISNSSAPIIRELYQAPAFKVEEIPARRNVNSKGAKRGPVVELLIS